MMIITNCTATSQIWYRKNYSKENINKDYARMVFSSKKLPLNDNDEKYAEIVIFDKNSDKPFAIAIGANPARGEVDIFDKTNFKIAQKLKATKKYKGYFLLNLYPFLTRSVKELNAHLNKITLDEFRLLSTMQIYIHMFLKNNINDVFIFWGDKISGPSAKYKHLLPFNLKLYIINCVIAGSNRFYYSADIHGDIIHPCKNDFDHFELLSKKNITKI